jgi:hypothetical protein
VHRRHCFRFRVVPELSGDRWSGGSRADAQTTTGLSQSEPVRDAPCADAEQSLA